MEEIETLEELHELGDLVRLAKKLEGQGVDVYGYLSKFDKTREGGVCNDDSEGC